MMGHKNSPKERFPLVFELGKVVEDVFEKVCKLNNIPVIRASNTSDRRDRIDFYIKVNNKVFAVDVKARRRLKRCDFSRWGITIELKNGYGTFNLKKAFTHIAFEIAPAVFLVTSKKVITQILKEKWSDLKFRNRLKGEEPDYGCLYTRNGKDLIVIFPEEEFINEALKLGAFQIYADVFEKELQPLIQREFEIYKRIKEGCRKN